MIPSADLHSGTPPSHVTVGVKKNSSSAGSRRQTAVFAWPSTTWKERALLLGERDKSEREEELRTHGASRAPSILCPTASCRSSLGIEWRRFDLLFFPRSYTEFSEDERKFLPLSADSFFILPPLGKSFSSTPPELKKSTRLFSLPLSSILMQLLNVADTSDTWEKCFHSSLWCRRVFFFPLLPLAFSFVDREGEVLQPRFRYLPKSCGIGRRPAFPQSSRGSGWARLLRPTLCS